jgi:hypothetical protein
MLLSDRKNEAWRRTTAHAGDVLLLNGVGGDRGNSLHLQEFFL